MARVMMLGRLADAAGWRERVIDAGSVSAIRARIVDDAPHVAAALGEASVSVIVNDVLTRGDAAVLETDEVAFMPPMSGG